MRRDNRLRIDLRRHLEESGSTKQGELSERLGVEPYQLSRLLTKLELCCYVTRQRAGTDKTVTLAGTG